MRSAGDSEFAIKKNVPAFVSGMWTAINTKEEVGCEDERLEEV